MMVDQWRQRRGRGPVHRSIGAAVILSFLLAAASVLPALAGFQGQQAFATGAGPESVAVADLNGDGKPDLAVANEGSANVGVLLGTSGSLQFSSAAVTVAEGGGSAAVTLTRTGSTDSQVSAIVSL